VVLEQPRHQLVWSTMSSAFAGDQRGPGRATADWSRWIAPALGGPVGRPAAASRRSSTSAARRRNRGRAASPRWPRRGASVWGPDQYRVAGADPGRLVVRVLDHLQVSRRRPISGFVCPLDELDGEPASRSSGVSKVVCRSPWPGVGFSGAMCTTFLPISANRGLGPSRRSCRWSQSPRSPRPARRVVRESIVMVGFPTLRLLAPLEGLHPAGPRGGGISRALAGGRVDQVERPSTMSPFSVVRWST